MTTSQDSAPSQIHIEQGRVFEGTVADESKMIDLAKAENRTLVGAFKSEGRSSVSDWPDGDYQVQGNSLTPL